MREKRKWTSIGGQALIEGVMMRGPHKTVLSVRKPDGTIHTEEASAVSKPDAKPSVVGKIPLVRGVVGFVQSLVIGYKCLMRSAELAGLDDLEEEEEPSKFEAWLTRTFGDQLMKGIMVIASVLGIALSVFLFMYLPALMFNGLQSLFGEGIANFRALFEGVVKILIFLVYMILVSRMKEIHRVFQYHGAEHKSIFCFEAGEELTVENVRRQSRFHPRCGTSFLIVMLLVGILVSFLFSYFTDLDNNIYIWTPVKILMVPLILALGYEFIRYAGRHDNLLTRVLSAPGLWMQRLTTSEPDDSMIEVAIASLKAVIPEQQTEEQKTNAECTTQPVEQP